MFRVVPMAEEHIEGFRAGLDSVARERRYLTFLEAPSLEESRRFVRRNIREGYPQHVALVEDKVVGWCDALPIDRPTRAHTGVLGIGVLAEFRGRGIASLRLYPNRAQRAGGGAMRALSPFTKGSDSCMKACNATRYAWTGSMRISSAWRCFSANFWSLACAGT
jgi:GNAT superfamily N-acetyltransferase